MHYAIITCDCKLFHEFLWTMLLRLCLWEGIKNQEDNLDFTVQHVGWVISKKILNGRAWYTPLRPKCAARPSFATDFRTSFTFTFTLHTSHQTEVCTECKKHFIGFQSTTSIFSIYTLIYTGFTLISSNNDSSSVIRKSKFSFHF